MKIVSWNVRGLGDWRKRISVRECLQNLSPDVVFFQETKLEEISAYIRAVWRSRFKD